MNQASEVHTEEAKPTPEELNRETTGQQVMCWKDPYKVCQCAQPRAGVFCGRFPMPTD